MAEDRFRDRAGFSLHAHVISVWLPALVRVHLFDRCKTRSECGGSMVRFQHSHPAGSLANAGIKGPLVPTFRSSRCLAAIPLGKLRNVISTNKYRFTANLTFASRIRGWGSSECQIHSTGRNVTSFPSRIAGDADACARNPLPGSPWSQRFHR